MSSVLIRFVQVRDWLVTADDRTGALETGAEIAGGAGRTTVAVAEPPAGPAVVDIGTRVERPDVAAERIAALPVARWNAHKMDSTLRGNWAHELRARAVATGRRVLLVPAWPAMGRTCLGGVVHVHGAPVGVVREHLPEAAALADLDALGRWILDGERFGVVDVADTDGMCSVAHLIARADLLVAGPAGPIGAAFTARFGQAATPELPVLRGPMVVVCGSATALSRAQVARLAVAHPEVAVFLPPEAVGELELAVVAELADLARPAAASAGTLVIVGGDTTAAVLGDDPRLVGGSVLPGLPWSLDGDGGGPLVVTKAGSFGDVDTLVRLVGLLQPPD
jgi:D-threonate/D-erythronate kinase